MKNRFEKQKFNNYKKQKRKFIEGTEDVTEVTEEEIEEMRALRKENATD